MNKEEVYDHDDVQEQLQHLMAELKKADDSLKNLNNGLRNVKEDVHDLGREVSSVTSDVAALRENVGTRRRSFSSTTSVATLLDEELGEVDGNILNSEAAESAEATSNSNDDEMDKEIVRNANEISHGGCLIGDIEAILEAESEGSQHVQQYKLDFGKVYGVDFEQALAHSSKYPPRLRRMLDIRASVQDLKLWRQPGARDKKDAVQRLIDGMMAQVKAVDGLDKLPALFEDGGPLAEDFKLMERIYLDHY